MLIRDNICSLIISHFNTQSYITSCTYSERRQITSMFMNFLFNVSLINLSYYPSKIATSEEIKYQLFSFVIKYKNSTGIMAVTERRWVKDVSYHVLPPTDFLSRVCWSGCWPLCVCRYKHVSLYIMTSVCGPTCFTACHFFHTISLKEVGKCQSHD